MKFSYQAKCFSEARSALMLPFLDGEAGAIAHAFHLCDRALDELRLDRHELVDSEPVMQSIGIVERAMDTTGLEDPFGVGLWLVKAQSMSLDERRAFSNAVAELAAWFDMQFWAGTR